MSNVHSLPTHMPEQRRLALKAKIDSITGDINRVNKQLSDLLQERDKLERQYYSPSELSNLKLQRRASLLDW